MPRFTRSTAALLLLLAAPPLIITLLLYPRPGSAAQALAMFVALLLGGVAAWRPRIGLGALLFLLPLLNNTLIGAPLGGAAAASLLALAWVSGVAARDLFAREPGAPRSRIDAFDGLLLIHAVYGAGSALLVLLRYTDFTLFQSAPRFYWVNSWRESGWEACRAVWPSVPLWLSGALTCIVTRRTIAASPAGQPSPLRPLLLALAAGLVPALCFALWQSAGRLDLGAFDHFSDRQRLSGTFTEANAAGLFVLPAAVLISALLARRGWALRAALGVLLLGLLWLIAASGSRTALLGLLLVPYAALWLPPWNGRGIRRAILISVVLLGLLVVGIIAALIVDTERLPAAPRRLAYAIQLAAERGPMDLARYERLRAWTEGCRMIAQHPLAGIGLGSYLHELPLLLRFELDGKRYRDNSNNFYLHAWAELGLPGLLLALLIGGWVGTTALRRLAREDADELPLLRALAALWITMPVLLLTGPHDRSPEIQVLLALLAAAIMAPTALRTVAGLPAAQRLKTPALVMPLVAALALAGLVGQTVLATGALSRRMLPERYGVQLSYGLHRPSVLSDGREIVWTSGAMAMSFGPLYRWIRVSLQCFHPDVAEHPVTVELLIDDQVVRRLEFVSPGQLQTAMIELPRRRCWFGLRTSRTWVAREHDPANGDARPLGVLMTLPEFYGPFDPALDPLGVPALPPS